jgi:pyruvate,water dikinase
MSERQGTLRAAPITWLADLGRGDAARVGAKAANLGELTRAGLAVPPGFVVSADSYLDAMDEGGVREELRSLHATALEQVDQPAALGGSAERLRALVRAAGVPDKLRAQVIDAYHRLGQEMPVAVRSSALGEDGEAASFAGMYDTYTNVVGDEALLERLVDCWLALFGERVIAYRSTWAPQGEPAIAVVVQQLVDAECAGVMFTADPATGDTDRVVIEAAYGLGEVVMGGELEPDLYVVAKQWPRLLHVRIGNKTHRAVASPDGTVNRVDVPPADVRRQAVSDTQIVALTQLAAEVERTFGGVPQDIEWAVADGWTYVLQARPITVHPSVTPPIGGGGEMLLRGLAAAPGTATGRVRILMSPEHWRRVEPGEVLVAPMVNPDWAPAVRRAAALVTDGGGITCHGAIVARELGVPCVVATRIGTSRLTQGSLVTVDGYQGVVIRGDGRPE